MEYHNPVLLKETVDGLNIDPNGIYLDVTFGGGGHSAEILKRLGDKGKLYAFDQDPEAIKNKLDDDRFTLISDNFRNIDKYMKFYGHAKVDGILGDFGVSSHQFDSAERGFSTRFDAVLDMRMNTEKGVDALHVINKYSEKTLCDVFFKYGELRNARAITKAVIAARNEKEIRTSFELKEVLKSFLPAAKEHKILAQIFQAIRIEVNEEIVVLKEFLVNSGKILKPKGRLSVISYHSLEDRLVKRYIKDGIFEGEIVTDVFGNSSSPMKAVGKLICPSREEIKINNRARSAKLRIAEKKND